MCIYYHTSSSSALVLICVMDLSSAAATIAMLYNDGSTVTAVITVS